MTSPLISIIIPFKNTDSFLEECLSSIQSQSYAQWECICVDDHSKDESVKIVEGFSKKDSRIQLIYNEGNGIIDALKTGYSVSKGGYITRMDSDDFMSSNRLDVMLNKLRQHGKNHLAVGQVRYFREDGLSDGFAKYERWLNSLTKTGRNYDEIYKECVIPSPCWMLHRDDFDSCGGFNSNRYPEDYDLAFRFYEAGLNCIACDDILLYWRDYSTRTSRTHSHYANNHFLSLKVHYFLKLNYDPMRPLTVWGAGTKGKVLAKLLIENSISFYWICDNPKKIGKHIYDQKLLNFDYLLKLDSPQSIVTVANENAQKDIKHYFKEQQMVPMVDYYFFC